MTKLAAAGAVTARDGTSLVRPRQPAPAPSVKASAIVAGALGADRLALSRLPIAEAGDRAQGFLAGLRDRSGKLFRETKFWLGIQASESRDWAERKIVVPWALWRGSSERSLTFEDAAGKPARAKVESVGVIGNHQTFRVACGPNSFLAEIPEGINADEAIKRVLNLYSQVPPHLRAPLKVVSISAGGNPKDPYKERKYGIEGFTSAATASGGVITFWNGLSHVRKGTFNHEMGHLVGRALYERHEGALGDFLNNFQEIASPRGWEDVASKDGAWVTSYSRTNPDEDFAEHWEAYMEAREKGGKALDEFRKTYPDRTRVLEAVFEGSI